MGTSDLSDDTTKHRAWGPAAIARFGWTVITAFVALSIIFGVSVLPAVAFIEWHTRWGLDPWWLRIIVLAMALLPTYIIFIVMLMATSALATRVLGWRPPKQGDFRITDLPWEICDWARYMIISHLVRTFAGPLFGTTPLWVWYMRWNGATVGKQVWVNSLGVTDHCLLELGDDVVIGSDVHLSAHTVERGHVRFAPVRIGRGSTIGVGSHVEIGADIGAGCQVGSLSMVPKYAQLDGPATWVGVPVHRIEPTVVTDD